MTATVSPRNLLLLLTAALVLAPPATAQPRRAGAAGAPGAADPSKPEFSDQIIFPEEPHAWFRIPSLVVAKSGVVLAFAERRIGTAHDYGHDSESVLRRSFDNGKT